MTTVGYGDRHLGAMGRIVALISDDFSIIFIAFYTTSRYR
jgi:hypothetical protein